MGLRRTVGLGILIGLTLGPTACIRKAPSPEMAIQLYSGIRGFVSLGDTESDVNRYTANRYVREDLPLDPPMATLRAVEVSHLFYYKDLGTKLYFRNGRVALIEVQDPFKGHLQGKNIRVFQLEALPEGRNWGEILERELGQPLARGAGGRFGAEALFYPWGDISFNRNGPNQVALYTDPAISFYRQRNFGREVRLFK